MPILRAASSQVKPWTLSAPEQAEPQAPCPTCRRDLWCYHDFSTGEYTYYCPSCDRWAPAGA